MAGPGNYYRMPQRTAVPSGNYWSSGGRVDAQRVMGSMQSAQGTENARRLVQLYADHPDIHIIEDRTEFHADGSFTLHLKKGKGFGKDHERITVGADGEVLEVKDRKRKRGLFRKVLKGLAIVGGVALVAVTAGVAAPAVAAAAGSLVTAGATAAAGAGMAGAATLLAASAGTVATMAGGAVLAGAVGAGIAGTMAVHRAIDGKPMAREDGSFAHSEEGRRYEEMVADQGVLEPQNYNPYYTQQYGYSSGYAPQSYLAALQQYYGYAASAY